MKYKFSIAILLIILIITALAFTPDQQLRRASDFFFDVGTGNVLNTSGVSVFGQNTDVDTAAAEDVWDGGGTWSAPTEAQLHEIVSDSAADASDSTGARTMQIYGLDGDGNLINETVSLSGTNTVTTTNEYTMIHSMIIRTAGVSDTNQGTISATAVPTDSTVTAQINANNNHSLMAIYQIPTNKKGCIVDIYASVIGGVATDTAQFYLYAKPDGEVFQVRRVDNLGGIGTAHINNEYRLPMCFDELTIVKFKTSVSGNDAKTTAGFDIILMDQQ
jgi:hypothetical protein